MRQVATDNSTNTIRAPLGLTPAPTEVSVFVLINFLLQLLAFILAASSMLGVVRADGGTAAERITFLLYVTALLLLGSAAVFLIYAAARALLTAAAALAFVFLLETLLWLCICAEFASFLSLGVHAFGADTWNAVGTADITHIPWWAFAGVMAAALLVSSLQYVLLNVSRHLALGAMSSSRWIQQGVGVRTFVYGCIGLVAFVAIDRPDAERLIPRAALPVYSIWFAPARTLPELRPLATADRTMPLPTMERRPDVVLLMAESLRGDMFTPEFMPRITQYVASNSCAAAEHHYAGGHLTQYGTFSLLYGLGSWAFLPFMQEGRGSWFLETFRANGYELIGLDASGVMSYAIPPLVPSQFDRYETRLREDSAIVVETRRLLAEEGDRRPRLIFTFLYGTHAHYFFPERHARYPTEGGSWAENLWGRYRNSVLYMDELLATIAEENSRRVQDGSLILAMTGDHGEEFEEHGLLGHASVSFYEERMRVPMIICGAGADTLRLAGPTEHADLLPTVMAWSGVESPESETTGRSMLREQPPRQVVLAGSGFPSQLGEFAIVTPAHKFWLRVRDPRFESVELLRVTRPNDSPLPDGDQTESALTAALAAFKAQREQVVK